MGLREVCGRGGVDERISIWRSTEAAAHHLSDLYERFRSWELALAAYNLGFEGLDRRLTVGLTVDQVLAQARVVTADEIKVGTLLDLRVSSADTNATRTPR